MSRTHAVESPIVRDALLALLDGAQFANAIMPWDRPGPIRLPDDPAERAAIVNAHLGGAPATVFYSPANSAAKRVRVEQLALAGLCPAADGLARWVGIDLDGSDHGASGLADPAHAARCIAERADNAGLSSGLLVARSRGGRGRHVFLYLPEPTALEDAVLGVAALASDALIVAREDVAQGDRPHAFRRADGKVAASGQSGAVELVPHSTAMPANGWALALPAAGRYAPNGGGVIIDPFDDEPVTLDSVPRCSAANWRRYVAETRARLPRQNPSSAARGVHGRAAHPPRVGVASLSLQTREFLDGCVAEGGRNRAAFAASCNLLGVGLDATEAERLILAGAAACGLPANEARAAFSSAVGARLRRARG